MWCGRAPGLYLCWLGACHLVLIKNVWKQRVGYLTERATPMTAYTSHNKQVREWQAHPQMPRKPRAVEDQAVHAELQPTKRAQQGRHGLQEQGLEARKGFSTDPKKPGGTNSSSSLSSSLTTHAHVLEATVRAQGSWDQMQPHA